MSLDLWLRTSGTWINVGTVLLGTALGLLVRGRLPLSMRQVMTQAVGLLTLLLGFTMATHLTQVTVGQMDGVIVGLMALVLGGLLGEWWKIEARLRSLGDWFKHHLSGSGQFTEGFVAASLLFCVGPMTLLGCLNNGLTGDNRLLVLKATMDGLSSVALTSSFGVGVGVSALVILVYQGGLSLAAGGLSQVLPDPTTAPAVLLATGVGGLMIVGIGLNLLEVAQIRVAAFLPALVLAPLFSAIAQGFG